MTDVAALPPEPIRHLEVWAECLSSVLGQVSGTPVSCALLAEVPPGFAPRGEDDLWLLGTFAGGVRGELSFRLPAASVRQLAQMFVGEAISEAPLTAEHREAAIELLRQVGGQAASALRASWGELQLRLDPQAGAPSWPASASLWLRAGEAESAPTLEVELSAALGACLRAGKEEPAPAMAASAPNTANHTAAASPPSGPAPPAAAVSRPADSSGESGSIRLDLLKDVELAVTLRFGSRRMTLGEVLDLSPGSVVDLDRKIAEAVDVLIDGRLVARGEVVVLEGNYGLRVTEVGPGAQGWL